MIRNLRKGMSSVYLTYSHTEDTINADSFTIEARDDVAILRFRLKPIDSNQFDDENNLHEQELLSVAISDDYIISKLRNFLRYNNASSMKLEITSRARQLAFNVKPGAVDMNRLALIVER